MSKQLDLYPTGLTRAQFDRLAVLSDEASAKPLANILADVRQHAEHAKAAHVRNRLVNVRLASAISDTVDEVAERWQDLPPVARSWLAAAFLYFADCDDEEPDFGSPIGFEDDAEILNACLRFAKLDDLCLNVEDYDDA